MSNIKVDKERCKSCGLCVKACPKKIIEISAEEMNSRGCRPAEVTDVSKCVGCVCCAIVCPDCAITLCDGDNI